jgi:hypothetical protein
MAADAEHVFIGTVRTTNGLWPFRRWATFEVLESFKGSSSARITVWTRWAGTACGVKFTRGEDYLVFGYGTGLRPATSACSVKALSRKTRKEVKAIRSELGALRPARALAPVIRKQRKRQSA